MLKRILIIVILSLLIAKLRAQAIVVEEEFNGGTTAPSGWSFTSIGSVLSSNSNYGKTAPSLVMDATNDRITSSTFVAGTANTLSFWVQSSGSAPTSSDLITVEYFNGSSWSNCTPATFTFNTTARMFEATFPATTATRVRITYMKVTTGVNAAIDDFTILSKAASCTTSDFLWFSSITYNSCNASACEGTDEFLTFINGNTALALADLEITVPGSGTGPEGTTFCGDALNPCDEYFTTNATYVASLNAASGCSGFFLSPPGNVIPANGRVMVFMGTPSATINFGTLCSSGGNYYCVFVSNTANCTGRYSNSANTPRYTTIRNRNTGCSVERSFTASLGGSADGDLVAFDPAGAATYSGNPSCAGFGILPIELTDFYAELEGEKIRLNWEMAAEENNTSYIVEKSTDAIYWETLTALDAKPFEGNKTYSTEDPQPENGINYYRLLSKNEQGTREQKVISVDSRNRLKFAVVTQDESELIINYTSLVPNSTLRLYNAEGKLVKELLLPGQEGLFHVSKDNLAKGLFLLRSNGDASTCKVFIY